MKINSLRIRLLLVSTLSVSVSLMLAFWGLSVLFKSHVERRAKDDLSVQMDQILVDIERDSQGRLMLGNAPVDARFSTPFGGFYWQIQSAGQILRSRSLWDSVLVLPEDSIRLGEVHTHTLPGPANTPLLVFERVVELPDRLGGNEIRVAVAMDAAQVENSAEEFREDLFPFTLLLAAFLVAASVFQVIIGLRPLNTIERRIARIRSGEIARVGDDFPLEIKPLTLEVDALLSQREKDVEAARHRAGDLAHGMKTPLQALLGEAERLRRSGAPEASAAIETLADTMRRHVDRELNRVRISARAATAHTDLAEALQRVAAVVKRALPDDSIDWRFDVPNALRVAADMEDLLEIFGALLENAARYARNQIDIRARAEAGDAVVTIRDDGPGITAERLGAMTERGARADESGTGLGLAIARELTETLGGTLGLQNRAPGLEVTIRLPLPST